MRPSMPFLIAAACSGIAVAHANALALDSGGSSVAYAFQTEDGTKGTLDLTVVVLDDLTPRPVPLTDFRVLRSPETVAKGGPSDPAAPVDSVTTIRTDEKGHATAVLAVGDYLLVSARPLQFKGKSLSWSVRFSIKSGETNTLKLADADATVTDSIPTTATATTAGFSRQISDEAKLYQSLKSGVVTVESENGHGSGFIVDASGLVMTNQHVVNKSHWTAIRFDRGIRVNANVVAEDRDADVAILRFNPAAYEQFKALKLADTQHGPVATEGERVLAIGSPLRQEKILTIGIISKVEENVLISDVNINHGNSGGPLINMAGEVIGLTTFLDSTTNGPGISGIVAIGKATDVLARARAVLPTIDIPSTDRLPDISPVPIPSSALTAADSRDSDPIKIKAHHNFEARIYTPFNLAAQENAYEEELTRQRRSRVRKRNENGVKDIDTSAARSNPFWMRYALDSQDAFVMVEVRPKLQETSGSKWRAFAGAMAGVRTPTQMEYRDDFYDMRLFRGTQEIEPLRRNRIRTNLMFDSYFFQVHDTAYGGMYLYDPSVFAPGEKVTIKMRRESDLKDWFETELGEKEQKKIWEQFAPYRAALAEAHARKTAANSGNSSSSH